jgi:hypothetical protein
MTDALAAIADDYREPQYHASKSRPWGNVISANLCRAKVARDPKPPTPAAKPKPAAAVAPIIAPHPPVIGRAVESYEDLVQAFRDRADDLEISRNEMSHLSGLADGHVAMLLMKKSPMKHIGPVSLPAILKVLGLRFRIEEDAAQTELTLRRRQRRVSTHAHYPPEFPPVSGRVKGWLFGYPAPTAAK